MKIAPVVLGVVGLLLAGPGSARRPPSCRYAAFTAMVEAGDRFEKRIGGDLVFRLEPERLGPTGTLDGWRMTIASSRSPDRDHIAPVTIPLRQNPEQDFGPVYGEDTKASLSRPHDVRFILDDRGYDHIHPLWTNALWPYSAPRPERAADEYVSALRTLPTGRLVVTVLSWASEPGTDSIRRMRFRADVTTPGPFALDPDLGTRTVPCPPPPR
jgi:hypothetical protein